MKRSLRPTPEPRRGTAARRTPRGSGDAHELQASSGVVVTSLRVLVVEDDAHSRRIARAVLHAAGLEVIEAVDGLEALVAVRDLSPDVILLDLSLPRLDGYEVARRIKADVETRHVPVIALTAHALAGDEARAREAGCDVYLAKPVDPLEIVQAVLFAAEGRLPGTSRTTRGPSR